MADSLFSLEIIINFIKISHSDKVKCLFPCVAFRLLNYPTIAINLLDEFDTKQLKLKLELNQEINSNLQINCFKDLLDKNGRYVFARGKSCLFRSDFEGLYGHLQNAPVNLILLDTYHEPYKFVGSSSVPLVTVINEIYDELKETDFDRPCTKLTHGVFDFKNLMGETIGHISLALRLSSFGSSLIPHIGVTEEAIERRRILSREDEHIHVKNEPVREVKIVKKLENTHVQTVAIDYKTAQIQISNDEHVPVQQQVEIPAVKQQQPETQQKNASVTVKRKTVIEDEFVFNYFCPPALHYNSENDKLKGPSKNEAVNEYEKKRIEYLIDTDQPELFDETENGDESHDDDASPQDNSIESDVVRTNVKSIKPAQDHHQSHEQVQLKQNFNLNEFPILKCLMDEISKLKDLTENNNKPTTEPQTRRQQSKPKRIIKSPKPIPQKPINPHHNVKDVPLVGILKSQPKIDKESLLESVNRLSQPRAITPRKIDQLQHIEPVSPKKKEKIKLKYGLTHTHRMRMLMNRPGKIDSINKEHLRLSEELKINLNEILQQPTPRPENMKQQQISISNSTGNNNSQKSSINLSLLNKVEMESTIDYAVSRSLFGLNKSEQSSTEQQQQQQQQQQKFVQFGNTYILNHNQTTTDDSPLPTPNTVRSTTTTTTTTTTTSNAMQPMQNNERNFIRKSDKKEKVYQYDFESSSQSQTQSKQTTGTNEQDDEIDELKISQLKLNSDYVDQLLASSSTKYSNEDFFTSTKSMEDDYFASSKETY